MRSLTAVLTFALGVSLAAAPAAAQVVKKDVPGVSNFAQIETTVACAGATTAAAVPELKKMGFKSIINLRLATEKGAETEAEAAAAKAAGIKYFHLPLNGQMPDPAVADQFLAAITEKGSEPAFIHCAGGNRAAAMWFIKRLVVDRWDTDRAATEAAALGMTSPVLKQFGIDYAAKKK
jgi:uncharacterized protein (TIGR01244 family)